MSKRDHVLKIVSVTALLAAPSLAEASAGSGSFTFEPLAAAANAVPVLGNVLLVVLGLLMVAIAVRAIKVNRGYQKLLCVAVLAGGLLVSGLGAERTLAVIDFNYIAGEGEISCEVASDIMYNPEIGSVTLLNGCTVPGTVANPEAINCICGTASSGTCNGTLEPDESCSLSTCDPC